MARRKIDGVAEILDAVGPLLESFEGSFADGPCAPITHDVSRNVKTGTFRSLDSKISSWFQPDKALKRFFGGEVVTYEASLPGADYFQAEYRNDWGRKGHVADGVGAAEEVRVPQMLTPRLARALWEEPSLVRIAERLGISVNTAKTGSASQAELLQLLAKATGPPAGKREVRWDGE